MRNLPVFCHWCDSLFTPKKQTELINASVPLMVNIDLKKDDAYYNNIEQLNLLRLAKSKRLPITMVTTQWEKCLVSEGGKLDPFLDISSFSQPAINYIDTPGMNWVQKVYPDPPRVLFLLNNETPKWTWSKLDEHLLFTKRYGKNTTSAHKREILRDTWIPRFRYMFDTARRLLTEDWSKVSRFIGYDAFPESAAGRYNLWDRYSRHTKELLDWQFSAFDGCSASYYTHNWSIHRDHWLMSPQIESMNYLWQQQYMPEDYYFELSCWDGNYNWYPSWGYDPKWLDESKACQYMKAGQTYNAKRYEGFLQFGLWLMRCNMREWRHYNTTEEWWPYTQKHVDSVQRIHNNDLLKRFWQHGELVANPELKHPYSRNMEPEWLDKQKFYLLQTDRLRSVNWEDLGANIPIFALAYRIEDEFLVYAHAPVKPTQDRIYIDGYGYIDVEVPREGRFWHLRKNVCEQI